MIAKNITPSNPDTEALPPELTITPEKYPARQTIQISPESTNKFITWHKTKRQTTQGTSSFLLGLERDFIAEK